MRFRSLAVLSVMAVGFFMAAPARAQLYVTPQLGVTFGGDAEHRFVYGAAVGVTGNVAGIEADFGYSPNFFGDTDKFGDLVSNDAKLSVTTFMVNLTLGGAPPTGGVRPFFSGGAGLIRGSVHNAGDLFDNVTRNDFGVNVGGGLHGFFNEHVGLRGDVRYFRALSDDDNGEGFLLDPTKFKLGDFNFWRAGVGVVLKF
jgi:hypothetical protein